jgi:large subunit ribosomal protein L29|tara:strand:- start:295 stop:486 length:192 start_codon:yes stop_codon:yes gene_type:complete
MKQQEVIKLSNDELKEQLIENKKKFNELKMAHAVSPLENPIQIKAVRKSIARIMTELTKRDNQ